MSARAGGAPPPSGRAAGFDRHTALCRTATGGALGTASWQARIEPELRGFGGAHGGYVSAIALRALTDLVDDTERLARSLTLQLTAPVAAGILELRGERSRTGSSISAASLVIEQAAERRGAAWAVFGRSRRSPRYLGRAMPNVPPPEACLPIGEKPAPEASAGIFVEHRPAAPPLPLSGGQRAEILVWMRLVEERPLDPLVAVMLADAGPPALFGRLERFIRMPSVEIAIQLTEPAAIADSPWLLGVFRTSHAADGYALEDGELWTPEGSLVLQARQLRRILDA